MRIDDVINRMSRRAALRLVGGATAGLIMGGAAPASVELRIQRLAWAGLRLALPGGSLLIDPLISPDVWGTTLKDRLVPVDGEPGDRFVLVTHRHSDHADPLAIRAALGDTGTLIHPAIGAAPSVPGVRMRSAALYEPQLLGDFTATAVPAADGYGDPQASWIVSAGGRRIIHCGDTLWHGHWWHIGRQYGPFDAAFLPINGARFSWRQPATEIPAVLTPEQAVAAAVVLGARRLVPIHYGVEGAEGYAEVDGPLAALEKIAASRQVVVTRLAPGNWLDWGG